MLNYFSSHSPVTTDSRDAFRLQTKPIPGSTATAYERSDTIANLYAQREGGFFLGKTPVDRPQTKMIMLLSWILERSTPELLPIPGQKHPFVPSPTDWRFQSLQFWTAAQRITPSEEWSIVDHAVDKTELK
ncbi:hypothetical protein ZHAS_00006650 [Anopheles sinensis]|uniref:Uncharacterized protein n=1 Tax=Anopheles sinensis TaxID=74873 RepID=A0A084VMV2_ANOSI|nr:hypothetical protein ZHAS_00006650 [Anopheles sinensis]